MFLTPRRVCWGTERGFRRLSFPDRPLWILSCRDGGRAAIRPDWGPSATRALQQTRTGPSRAPSLALIETKPVASLPGRGGDCRRLGSSALGDVRSPLKKPPGEGTGPTIDADLRGNLVGRVPPRGEPGVFQQAVRGGFIAPTRAKIGVEAIPADVSPLILNEIRADSRRLLRVAIASRAQGQSTFG